MLDKNRIHLVASQKFRDKNHHIFFPLSLLSRSVFFTLAVLGHGNTVLGEQDRFFLTSTCNESERELANLTTA